MYFQQYFRNGEQVNYSYRFFLQKHVPGTFCFNLCETSYGLQPFYLKQSNSGSNTSINLTIF